MKIAYLTSQYARASDTFIRNEVVELRRRGHEVSTFSIRRDAAVGNLSEEVRTEQASTTYILEQPLLALAGALAWAMTTRPSGLVRTLRLAWQTRAKGLKGTLLQLAYVVEAAYLGRALLQKGVQILHNHIAENSANVAMLASTLSGVPYSMTVHGPGIFYHPRHWALGEKVARSAFTATITDFCRSQCMLFSEPEHWAKLHVVRCAVGPSFKQGERTAPATAPRLVFVGRLCAEKGLPILMAAVAKVLERGVAIELVLVGDGPLRPDIEAMMKAHGLGHAIKLLGWQSSEGVLRELHASRGLVLPSFAEGLPVVIMESLAMGRPVISTQIAGIPELVVPGGNGWLVPAGAVDALADAMAEVAQASPEVLKRMGQHGAQAVARLHDFATEVSKLEGLLLRHGRQASSQGH